MTTHARPERRSLFADGADLPLFTQALEHTITADLIADCEPRPLTKAPPCPRIPILMAAADIIGYPITSCEWIAAANALLDQLRPYYPGATDNAAAEVARLDAERYRSVDVLGWRGHDHPLDKHAERTQEA